MIQYLPGWTYISKRGVRVTLMAVDGDRVKHCNNNHRSVLTIAETSLANFKRWTDEKKTVRLHRQIAHSFARKRFIRPENGAYAMDLITSTP